jgi:outer membrane protein
MAYRVFPPTGLSSMRYHPALYALVQSMAATLVALSAICNGFAQSPPSAPDLTLSQAVNTALQKNPLRKAAQADSKATQADVRAARSLFMPRLTFSEAATRGNDPVYVFGSKLRQQRFTSADFALNKLNTPLPFGNFATRFGANWNLFDSFATWHGIARSQQMNKASNYQLDRTEQEIIFRVISAYYQVLLAQKELDISEQAVKTAQAIVDETQARFDTGLVVESDLLTAKVRQAGRQQDFIRARNNLDLARAQLNTAMGVTADSAFQVSEALGERSLPLPVLQDLETRAVANRPDLKRIESEEAAQRQSVSIAKSSFGPQIGAFAGWELDNPTFVGGGGGNNWLGGIEVKFDIFDGGAKRAELSRQRAVHEKVLAMKQAAVDAVRLEVRRAYYEFDASRQQTDVARAAVAQAQESLRISQDRYSGGLTTITDLLATEDAARRSQTNYWDAIYRFHTSYANLELASGSLTPQSPVVTP